MEEAKRSVTAPNPLATTPGHHGHSHLSMSFAHTARRLSLAFMPPSYGGYGGTSRIMSRQAAKKQAIAKIENAITSKSRSLNIFPSMNSGSVISSVGSGSCGGGSEITKLTLPPPMMTTAFTEMKGREELKRPAHFFDLMPFMRYRIYNMLPTSERVWAQLACRSFRDEIRVRIGIGTFVDEETLWGLSFMRDIIVDTIKVGQYGQPKLKPRDLILRWYDVLHLIFAGPISIPYLDAFLARCRAVKKITIECDISQNPPIPMDYNLRRDYKSWRKLDLIKRVPYEMWYCKLLVLTPRSRTPHTTIQYALEVINCVSLVKIKIEVEAVQKIGDVRKIHSALLRYMESHPQLKEVFVNNKVAKFDHSGKAGGNKKDFLLLEREVRAIGKRCQLRELTVLEERVDFMSWACILLEQLNLEVLQVLHSHLFPIYLYTIETNRSLLRKIAIHAVLYTSSEGDSSMGHLDLGVFNNCKVLKSLYIYVSNSALTPRGVWVNEIRNFKELPEGLETLALRNVSFSPKDFMSVTCLKNLRSLGVTVIVSQDTEIPVLSRRVFRSLVRMRRLEELLIQGMNFTRDVRETMTVPLLQFLVPSGRNTIYLRERPEDPESGSWESYGSGKRFRFKIKDDETYEV